MDATGARGAVILDLDDTLHSSAALARAYADLAVSLVARRHGITADAGREMIRVERDRLSAEMPPGQRATVSRTLESLGVPLSEWAEARDREIDAAPLVTVDTRLRRQLERLAGRYTLAILTNNSRAQTEAITAAIGIRDLFDDRIFTVTETRALKPDPALFRHVADALDVPPERCISIGDRLAIDVEPARQCGMRGLVVSAPGGIYAVLDALLAELP